MTKQQYQKNLQKLADLIWESNDWIFGDGKTDRKYHNTIMFALELINKKL